MCEVISILFVVTLLDFLSERIRRRIARRAEPDSGGSSPESSG